jgi:hypothetical protein
MSQVQAKAGANNGATTSVIVSGLTASTSGNLLLAFCYTGDSTNLPAANITDTIDTTGGTWKKYGADIFGSECYYKENCPANITSVTATITAAARSLQMIVVEYKDAQYFDVRAANLSINQQVAATSFTSNNSSTTFQDNCVAYGFHFGNSTGLGMAPSGSWTAASGTNLTSGVFEDTTNGVTLMLSTQTITSAAALAATGTGASAIYESSVFIFKLAYLTNVAWITA